MLDRDTRAAILKLAAAGNGNKAIARALDISKHSVKKVLNDGQVIVPAMARGSRLDEHADRIRDLHLLCKGNFIRVHEELNDAGVEVAYQTLTAFCRQHDIGVTPKVAAGRYDFTPGQEMQHDTSPHTVQVAGKMLALQCASLVLCFSRKQYAQVYPRWSRLECRHFLSEGVVYLGGAGEDCMIDNSSVVLARGSGKNAVPSAEMAALGQRFGFKFVAHALGDADRSARVERPFHFIENNFYPGRTFKSLEDLNTQLLAWLDRNFNRFRKRLGASPAELFRSEALALRALPLHVPEVYVTHERRVDVEGYVNLHTNRYSVDARWLHLRVEVREAVERLRIFHGHELIAEHVKEPYGMRKRATLPEHKGRGRRRRQPAPPSEEERVLRAQGPELDALITTLRAKHGGHAVRAVRRLQRIWQDYPTEPVCSAIAEALHYGLTDLGRIETMILRRIAGEYFRIPIDKDPGNDADMPEPGGEDDDG